MAWQLREPPAAALAAMDRAGPAVADPYRGAWSGPVYVLTDRGVHSAAEAFTTTMRDNGIARTIGVRTGGSGCGNMQKMRTMVLPNSQLRYVGPDCMRLRVDGTSEVMGIASDIEVAALPGESERARAARVIAKLEADLARTPR